MAWKLEIEPGAERALGKLATAHSKRIAAKLREIAASDNPRLRGRAMAGKYAGHWRYRVGDYRIIARIEDGRMVIVVVALGHRREVYR